MKTPGAKADSRGHPRWRRPLLAISGTAVVLLGVTGCQPGAVFTVDNKTSEALRLYTSVSSPTSSKPDVRQLMGVGPGKDSGPDINNIPGLYSNDCSKDVSLIAIGATSGKRYVYGPPVCKGKTWTIDDSTPTAPSTGQ
ncbi:hypothetical protein ACIRQQ_46295 [Streptomyces fuscichromogenes]|uniref:hypothetical protein n=1 Tax=Streptomyces fuscichromogenes TaxID=1324013 RepID=UPI003808EF1D